MKVETKITDDAIVVDPTIWCNWDLNETYGTALVGQTPYSSRSHSRNAAAVRP